MQDTQESERMPVCNQQVWPFYNEPEHEEIEHVKLYDNTETEPPF